MESKCVWCGKPATKEQPLEMVMNEFIHREPCLREADIYNEDGTYYEELKATPTNST
uniref:Uncharacterized protein n=1 Tax=viral metagenome TaxID=1070528 RepID=A0A6M3LLN7_9ZZZZ